MIGAMKRHVHPHRAISGTVLSACAGLWTAATLALAPQSVRAATAQVSKSTRFRPHHHGQPHQGGPTIFLQHGKHRIALQPSVLIDHRSRSRGGPRRDPPPIQIGRFRKTALHRGGSGNWALVSRTENATCRLTLTVHGQQTSPLVWFEVAILYKKKVFVRREHLRLTFPCQHLRYLGRAEKPVTVRSPGWHRVDRWTHRRVEVRAHGGRWSLLSATPLTGMSLHRFAVTAKRRRPDHRAQPRGRRRARHPGQGRARARTRQTRRPKRRCGLVLELDDSRNHPVRYAARCKRYWYPPARRLSRSRRPRFVKQTNHSRMLLRLGTGARLHKNRLPHGYRAAIVFADHADQSARGPLKALLLGRSDATFTKPQGGFIGNGLALTKTLFFRRAPFPQLSSPPFRRLVRRAARRSIEIGAHSATPFPDSPAVTRRFLQTLRKWGSSTWIDHQPDTNCEAFSGRGWQPKSRYFIADILADTGFRHVWSGHDMQLKKGQINMLRPSQPRRRTPLLFPFPASPRHKKTLLLFRSVWFYMGPQALRRRLSRAALKKFISRHGLLVAHTYLDAHHPRGHRRHKLALIRRTRRGVWYLHPQAEKVLNDLSRLQKKGVLWVPTVQQLITHLQRWDRIALIPAAGGRLKLSNPLAKKVKGFTFAIDRPVGRVSGARAKIQRVGQRTWITLDLPAKRLTIVELRDPRGHPVLLFGPRSRTGARGHTKG